MTMTDHIQWKLREQRRRWEAMRAILAKPWTGDRGWEGRTIGLHLPLDLRNRAVRIQENLGLRSVKETLFRALEIGFVQLEELPPVSPMPENKPPLRLRPPSPLPGQKSYDDMDEDDFADDLPPSTARTDRPAVP